MVGTLTMPFYGTELEGGGRGVLVCVGGGGCIAFSEWPFCKSSSGKVCC